MTLIDGHGLAVSTSSRPALDAVERALWRMMSFYGAPLDDLDAAMNADPAWALPHAMKAGFLFGLTEPALRSDAFAALATAGRLAGRANERERSHVGALKHLATGDWRGACASWTDLLADHPRDALALQWGHLFDFYRGDSAMLQERIGRALPTWHAGDPLQPYVLGLHAFGLEEIGRYGEAEAAGRQALAGTAKVPWAIHAVAHVMEMQGRHGEGQRWMHDWRPDWGAHEGEQRNGFAGHLGWHEALFALESLDHDGALAAFDAYLHADATEITLQRLDAVSLLWRLSLHGADVGQRWQALLAGWTLGVDEDADSAAGHSTFNDVHALLALLGAGQTARAEAWLAASIARSGALAGWNREVMRDVGAPLMHGLLAFGQGRHDNAAEALMAVRGRLAPIGGSHAQRDVVDQTLLAACARGSHHAAGRALLAQRAAARPPTPLSAWWAAALR
ncbi:MAG: tetratricopeptide repeat protein [Caldimonas sp.]